MTGQLGMGNAATTTSAREREPRGDAAYPLVQLQLGVDLERAGCDKEAETIAAMVMMPKPAMAIATLAGVRAAMFGQEEFCLAYNAIALLDSLRRLTGDHAHDQRAVFQLLCRVIPRLTTIRWMGGSWAQGWTAEQRWSQLISTSTWSEMILAALWEKYPVGTDHVLANARRLVHHYQISVNGLRHFRHAWKLLSDLVNEHHQRGGAAS